MNARRRGLGRGLDALLGAEDVTAPDSALRELNVGRLRANRFQPRSQFDAHGLEELAESIRAQGVLQPLVVTDDGEAGFTIIAGERRWRAAKMAGLATVPVLVREVAGEQQMLELALVENLQRADLDAIEEAEAYRHLAERFGLSQEAIGQRVGKSRPSVTNALRLLRLPPQVRDMLRDGRITPGQARPLLALGDAHKQAALAERAVAEHLSARQLETLAGRDSSEAPSPSRPARSPQHPTDVHTRAAMERLTRLLQTSVEIRRKRRGGEIRIRFHSEDELIRLFDHLSQGKGDP